jgi:hypothetical protein
MSVVLMRREAPAPDVAIQEYPVHAMPFKRPNNVFVSVPVGIFHPVAPFGVVVYAIWLLVFDVTSPTTTHIGVDAPVLYRTALQLANTGGIPSPLGIVAAAHPAPISSASARHEILLAGAPVPPPPPPQQTHADPLYPTELIRMPGSTEVEVVIALQPVAPVRSFV